MAENKMASIEKKNKAKKNDIVSTSDNSSDNPDTKFIEQLLSDPYKIEYLTEFKDELLRVVKDPKELTVKEIFPNYTTGSKEHAFLKSLRDKNIIRPQGGGFWQDNKDILLTAQGVDLASKCGLDVKPLVFVSYSHKDRDWQERVQEHLSVLYQNIVVDLWSDNEIGIGERWRNEIKDALVRSTAAILLISSSFFSSEFIREIEIPQIVEKLNPKNKERFYIFPILVRPCAWKTVGWLNDIQIRPKNNEALSVGNDVSIDIKLAEITEEIYEKLMILPRP